MSDFNVGLAEILEIEANEVNMDFKLEDDIWDSLAIVSTIALLDEVYGIIANGEDLAKCNTVKDILALVETK